MEWSNKKIKVKFDSKPITKYEKIRFAYWVMELPHTTLHIYPENLRVKWKLPLNIKDHICQSFLYSTPLVEVYHWYSNLTSFLKMNWNRIKSNSQHCAYSWTVLGGWSVFSWVQLLNHPSAMLCVFHHHHEAYPDYTDTTNFSLL